jgi:hypothetical protein
VTPPPRVVLAQVGAVQRLALARYVTDWHASAFPATLHPPAGSRGRSSIEIDPEDVPLAYGTLAEACDRLDATLADAPHDPTLATHAYTLHQLAARLSWRLCGPPADRAELRQTYAAIGPNGITLEALARHRARARRHVAATLDVLARRKAVYRDPMNKRFYREIGGFSKID